jgi:chemosensory pili system protein ChpA (sensor histidine kinase/response regulator)
MGASQDIAPLAWVIDEIRGSLAQAVTGVKSYVANKQDAESLRSARNQVHQANGALQLLDLRGVALLTEAIEALLRRWESEPKECLPTAVKTVETAINAVIAYLEGLLAGRPNQPIRLYPYYRDVLTLNRAARVHPADLVFADLSRRPAFHQIEVKPLTADQLRVRRVVFEEGLLGFLRDAEDPKARRRMRDALMDLERLPQRGLARSFWWIVRGLLEALDARQVQVDVDLKRVLARLNLQLRRLIEGGSAVAERLMTDTLYYVGRAGDAVPRVAEVKRLYGLEALIPADFERATLTAIDADALRGLRDALTGAKTVWGQLVGGNGSDAAKFSHEISMAQTAAQRLEAAPLARVLGAIGEVTSAEPAAVAKRESVGLEVASALLFVELGTDELPQIDPEYATRAQTVVQRLAAASAGRALPDGAPWMSELARRAQDRLTMGSVVTETQTTLREIEQRLDRFFRNPAERGELLGTVPLFDQVCGVLSVLGHDEPVAALRQVQQMVKNFANPAVEARPDEFQRIAQNLGAVGFFVETLSQDVEQPRNMFHYDPGTGMFSADLGQGPVADDALDAGDEWTPPAAEPVAPVAVRSAENVEAAAAQHQQDARNLALRLVAAPLDNAALQLLARLLPQLTAEADLLDDTDLKERVAQAGARMKKLREDRMVDDAQAIADLFAPAPEAPVPELTAPLPDSQAAADRELLDIFIEEANEVLDGLGEQLALLRKAPTDQATLTTARRAFHTLKGSSRMVGLKQFGEAAWGVEQCFNLWLAQERAASDDLLGLASALAGEMHGWIDRIGHNPRTDLPVAPWVQAAQRVREGGAFDSAAAGATSRADSAPKSFGSAAPEAPTALSQDGARSDGSTLGDLDRSAPVTESFALDPDALIADTVIALAGVDDQPPAAGVSGAPRTPALSVVPAAAPPTLVTDEQATAARDDVRRVGPIEISHGLYSVFLTEADEAIRLLTQDVAEWRFEPLRAVIPGTVRRAHSLAGISGTVGLTPVWEIVDPLDDAMHALQRVAPDGVEPVLTSAQFDVLDQVLERVRGMLHQFAAGIYPDAAPREAQAIRALLDAINAHHAAHFEALAMAKLEAVAPPAQLRELTADGTRAAAALSPALAADLLPDTSHVESLVALPLPDDDAGADFGDPPAALFDATVETSPQIEAQPLIGADTDVLAAPATPAAFTGSLTGDDSADPMLPTFMPLSEPIEPSAPVDPEIDALLDELLARESAAPTPQATEAAEAEALAPEIEPLTPAFIAPVMPAASALPLTLADDEADGDGEGAGTPAAVSSVRDELDADLLPVFLAEAGDLMPAVATNLRALGDNPNDREVARDLMRQLHTVKGSARMAGAMRLGELVHDMETRIESAMQLASVPGVIVDDLHGQYDRAMQLYEALQRPQEDEPAAAPVTLDTDVSTGGAEVIDLAAARDERDERAASPPGVAANSGASTAPLPPKSILPLGPTALPPPPTVQPASFIRVRADVLDKLVDQAGEVSIARAKLENELGSIKGGLTDLTENISRLRTQLREVEIQAEAQIAARADRLDRESETFDPLEYDRYTRLQELTRLLAESVEDVAMVQANMVKGLQLADTDLTAQSRLTRELQQQLMRVRLVPFSNISERLYRVARQTAKELDKRVSLEVRGGTTEIDRGVLERMGGPFEHIVRNAIVHGLEMPDQRLAAGKGETGELSIEVRQEGNEIIVVCADDGAGLNLPRIRERALEKGLIGPQQAVTDRELMELVFAPGFSTASEVTELAGRGVGMDVVRNELASFGGRVAIASEPGRGTRFTLYLPLTLAVTQVVLATVGHRRYAIPAGMVEQVRRFKPAQVVDALTRGELDMAPIGRVVLRPLGQLLGEEVVLHQGKQAPVVLVRSGEDRLAIYADDLSSNQEVVVKSVGPQVSRLAGILGATILGNGEIVLIINPVQLIARSPEPWQPAAGVLPAVPTTAVEARRAQERAAESSAGSVEARGLIMVVDDSLTVRRVTQRLLERNGYDVMLAKDGVDALRQLQDAKPDVMLVDIEMPRMDGFDLTRNVRASSETRAIPIMMITSRTAEKHRSVAFDVGVNEYLGKPYQEDELLGLIKRYMAERASA